MGLRINPDTVNVQAVNTRSCPSLFLRPLMGQLPIKYLSMPGPKPDGLSPDGLWKTQTFPMPRQSIISQPREPPLKKPNKLASNQSSQILLLGSRPLFYFIFPQ
jgi:hypothetical protein